MSRINAHEDQNPKVWQKLPVSKFESQCISQQKVSLLLRSEDDSLLARVDNVLYNRSRAKDKGMIAQHRLSVLRISGFGLHTF